MVQGSPAAVRARKRLPVRVELAAVFLAGWGIALSALAQGIPWGDSPELMLAGVKLLNAHTTGYALWLMLVHAASALPVVLAAPGLTGPWLQGLAAVLACATAQRVGATRVQSALLGLAAAACHAWVASARGLEVYGAAIVVLLGLGWALSRVRATWGGYVALVAFFWLAGAVHHGLTLLGGTLWLLGMVFTKPLRPRFFKLWPAILFLAVLFSGVLWYHPLRSAAQPPGGWDWCAPHTVSGMTCLLTGEGFRQFGGSPSQLVANLVSGVESYLPLLVVLVALGVAGFSLRGMPRRRWLMSLLLLLAGLGLSAAYMTREKEAFASVWLAVLFLPAAQGLVALGPRRGLFAALTVAMVSGVWLGFRWPRFTARQGGEELALRVMEQMDDPAILLVDWDQDPQLHYLFWQEMSRGRGRVLVPAVDAGGKFTGTQSVGLTRKVQVVYTFLLPFHWYREQQNREAERLWGTPLINQKFFPDELPAKNLLTRLVFRDYASLEHLRLYVNKFDESLYLKTNPGAYRYLPGPLSFRVVPGDRAPRQSRVFQVDPNAFAGDPGLTEHLARFLTYRGTIQYLEQERHRAYHDFRLALEVDPAQYPAHWYLGLLYNQACFTSLSQARQLMTTCEDKAMAVCPASREEECRQRAAYECVPEHLSRCIVLSDEDMADVEERNNYGKATEHFQAALHHLEDLVRREPDNPVHYIFLSNIQSQFGNEKKAEEYRLKAEALMGPAARSPR